MNRKNADRSKQKKKRTAKDIVLDILLVVFLLIAVWSGAYLGRYYYIAKNAQNNFNDLKGMLDTDGDDTEKVTVEVSDKSKDNGEKKILKKFEKLYEKNSDIAGWLTIDGTTIDYPVMYTPDDNDYYLHLDFDKNWSDPGTPFIDTNCRPFDDRTDNVLIYGHNMRTRAFIRSIRISSLTRCMRPEHTRSSVHSDRRYILTMTRSTIIIMSSLTLRIRRNLMNILILSSQTHHMTAVLRLSTVMNSSHFQHALHTLRMADLSWLREG